MIKRISIAAILLLAGAACGDVAPPVGPGSTAVVKSLGPDSTVDDVLDALDDRGQHLTSFTADLQTSDQDLTFGGDPVVRNGKIWYQTGPANTILHLILNKKTVGKKVTADKREYQLDGVWLTDRDYNAKIEVKRQIAPPLTPGQKVNLFQLDKGPFPLPIGQKKSAVLKEFAVVKMPPANPDPAHPENDDPPKSIHLQLTPKPGTPLSQSFSTIDVWVDPADHFPVRIETVDNKKAMDKVTNFSNVVVNPQIDPADLQPGKVDQTWKSSSVPSGQ